MIIQPTSLAALTWLGAASGTTAESWRIGVVLSARPLGVTDQGKILLQVGGMTVEADLSGQSGGGVVRVTFTGKGQMTGIVIDPSLLKADEKDILEDLIVAACNDAKAKAAAAVAEEMKQVTGGLSLPPGMKLPF